MRRYVSRFMKENWSWPRFMLLVVFWLFLTYSVEPQQLFIGLICAALVVFISLPFQEYGKDRLVFSAGLFYFALLYALHLVKEIIKANIEVAKIVLSPRMAISPTVVKFNGDLHTPILQVLLANSITLTPGTLTVSLEDDVYLVHCLTEEGAEDVPKWYMKEKLKELEKEGAK